MHTRTVPVDGDAGAEDTGPDARGTQPPDTSTRPRGNSVTGEEGTPTRSVVTSPPLHPSVVVTPPCSCPSSPEKSPGT